MSTGVNNGELLRPRQGQELILDPSSGEMLEPRPFFKRFVPNYNEDPRLMLLIDRKAVDLSAFELRRLINFFAADENPKGLPYAVRYFGLLADTFGPLIVIALAVPFAVSGVRVNPAVGVSKSIGLFFLYYILMNLATTFATKQVIDPMLAAWLPNLGMGAIALGLFTRLR
jgi:lipopolysaccharide export system permease protein